MIIELAQPPEYFRGVFFSPNPSRKICPPKIEGKEKLRRGAKEGKFLPKEENAPLKKN